MTTNRTILLLTAIITFSTAAWSQTEDSAPSPPGEIDTDQMSESPGSPLQVIPPGGQPGPVSQPGGSVSTKDFKLPPELQKEADAIKATFEKKHKELELAMGEMRATHTRYINGEDQSPEAAQRYRSDRDLTRKRMNELYLVALDLFRYMPDELAAQYVATIIEHRTKRDIYDITTAEGSARLIDAGLKFVYLFHAAGRSSVVSGDFALARRIYESVKEDQLEEADLALFGQLEELEESYRIEQETRQKEIAEDRLPRVRLKTTRGDVVIELFTDNAPSTASHFIQLVEKGFYDGLCFHQVIDHLLALTGDPSGVGTGNSGKFLVDEHDRPDARKAFRGSLVMAKIPIGKTGDFMPNSASSQFAILFLPMTRVTNQQTVFGQVIEGMDVISVLRRVDPSKEKKKGEIVLPPDRLLIAEVIRRPDKLPEVQYAQAMDQNAFGAGNLQLQ